MQNIDFLWLEVEPLGIMISPHQASKLFNILSNQLADIPEGFSILAATYQINKIVIPKWLTTPTILHFAPFCTH